MNGFSLARVSAVLMKEFIQLKRDRLTFGMMAGIPLLQLILFGFAINNDPKHLPTAVVIADSGPAGRSLLSAFETSDYFRIVAPGISEAEAHEMLDKGELAFVVTIPPGFERDLVRGERPELLVEADASDPSASGNALAALPQIVDQALTHYLEGALNGVAPTPGPVNLVLHRAYNPEGIMQYNIVPGLLGIVLTMSMIMMTALSLTREIERGTMENLLATPVQPVEVMAGKILPCLGIGLVQVVIILLAARYIFGVPTLGSWGALAVGVLLFVSAMLAIGYTFSTLASNQMQAMQMTFFFFLPSLLLSGYLFPFRAMPEWAQVLGQIFPLTHFLRVVRGVLLRGNGFAEAWPNLWPIAAFFFVAAFVALRRYRKTLD